MSEPKLISPLLDNYMMGDAINEKLGSRCCPALERDLQSKCIVKIISTPASQAQLDALLLSGAYPDSQSALQYFQSIADGIVDEAKILQRLSQLEGFFPYIGWQVVPMDDGVGFDIYTLSEYRRTLHKLLKNENLTHLSAVNLGLDICTALAVCRRIGYQYVNLKPENIYLADNKTWKIGDIGFVRLDNLKYASLPERYRSEYTAPEIEDALSSLNTTLDVYALGLILYRIYNGNQLPTNFKNKDNEPLVPPDYADYEMSEIILKACDPSPEKRWQDPIEMGQALVGYMQRNSVNDEPIIPAPVITEEVYAEATHTQDSSPETVEDESPEEIESQFESEEGLRGDTEPEELIGTESDSDDLSDLLTPSDDETSPEQNEDILADIAVTPEVSDILSQADEMAEHPVPEMPVNADLSDELPEGTGEEQISSLPSSEVTDDNTDIATENIDSPQASAVEPLEAPDSSTPAADTESPELITDPALTVPDENDNIGVQSTDVENTEETEYETEVEVAAAGKKAHWLRNLLIGCVALILAALAFFYYSKYYLQTIDTLNVTQSLNGEVIIHVTTQADESSLVVVCADTYGNPRKASVSDGIAVFDNLAPGSAYTIRVEIEGFHKLTGKTTTSFTTPNQLEIIQLDALTGYEDGSAILTFTTKDQDSDEWRVTYIGDDGVEVIETFKGHTHTINNLTVGKEYTFTIAPESEIKYTGTTEVKHVAAAVIAAEDVRIQSIADNKMTVSWSAPDGSNVDSWKVHCYNSSGFDSVITVDTSTFVIDGIDPTAPYIVEVSAAGMTVTARADVPANAVTVTDFKAKQDNTTLTLSWICGNADAPESWLLSYSIDNNINQEVTCSTPSFTLDNIIPAAEYAFTLKTSDGAAVLGGQITYKTAKAEKFSAYKVTAADMRFHACRTPSKSNWSKKDLKASDYTTTFNVGEKMSFLSELKDTYNTSDDQIVTMFVFRDENGSAVDFSTVTRTWKQMWFKGVGELDVPALPSAPGKYTVTIYMNGSLAGETKITITQ